MCLRSWWVARLAFKSLFQSPRLYWLWHLQAAMQKENEGTLVQKIINFKMVTAEHQRECRTLLRYLMSRCRSHT